MRIFSGIQPTGEIHIGNYFGAIKQWVNLQEGNSCLFCIVDLHAITTSYEKNGLQASVREKLIAYLAAGIDPEKSIIFIQSKIKEHTELCWLLNTVTPLSSLKRMTQYKEKAKKNNKSKVALLNYPILMAADVLLYDTQIVPVGEDQKQHIELTREIARRFNNRFGDTFVLPKSKLPQSGARIMSLSNPQKKMSKSDPKESYISLFDSPEMIKKKIGKAVTDTEKNINYSPKRKPGISNLLTIHSILAEKKIEELEKEMEGISYKAFKENLSDLIIERLGPFRRKKKEFQSREVYLEEILKQGERHAKQLAEAKIEEVKERMGL